MGVRGSLCVAHGILSRNWNHAALTSSACHHRRDSVHAILCGFSAMPSRVRCASLSPRLVLAGGGVDHHGRGARRGGARDRQAVRRASRRALFFSWFVFCSRLPRKFKPALSPTARSKHRNVLCLARSGTARASTRPPFASTFPPARRHARSRRTRSRGSRATRSR